MDNLRVGWDSPEEDIVALSILTSLGERFYQVFPRDLAEAGSLSKSGTQNHEDSLELIKALRGFSRKLVLLHRKQVLFKSPGHIARVREILEVFAQARFVTIFRNPLDQTASLNAMSQSGNPFWCALQWPCAMKSAREIEKHGIRLSHYFETRALIPAGNLIEIKFKELVADRMRMIKKICEFLSLSPPSDFNNLAATVRNARSSGYPPTEWIPLIREHYSPLFDAGLYPKP